MTGVQVNYGKVDFARTCILMHHMGLKGSNSSQVFLGQNNLEQ